MFAKVQPKLGTGTLPTHRLSAPSMHRHHAFRPDVERRRKTGRRNLRGGSIRKVASTEPFTFFHRKRKLAARVNECGTRRVLHRCPKWAGWQRQGPPPRTNSENCCQSFSFIVGNILQGRAWGCTNRDSKSIKIDPVCTSKGWYDSCTSITLLGVFLG